MVHLSGKNSFGCLKYLSSTAEPVSILLRRQILVLVVLLLTTVIGVDWEKHLHTARDEDAGYL